MREGGRKRDTERKRERERERERERGGGGGGRYCDKLHTPRAGKPFTRCHVLVTKLSSTNKAVRSLVDINVLADVTNLLSRLTSAVRLCGHVQC